MWLREIENCNDREVSRLKMMLSYLFRRYLMFG
jgi:hypothetical protein